MTSPQREIGIAIAMLVEAFGVKLADMTPVRIKVYEKVMSKVPPALLVRAAEHAISTRTFLPRPAEFLADAEHVRRALLSMHPYDGCADCERGWQTAKVNGLNFVKRCDCFTRWQDRLSALGVGHEPLALPPATRDSVLEEIG